jgi:hypothetical protein
LTSYFGEKLEAAISTAPPHAIVMAEAASGSRGGHGRCDSWEEGNSRPCFSWIWRSIRQSFFAVDSAVNAVLDLAVDSLFDLLLILLL